jgi:transcriptional regulator with XRE-family HTH domain
LQLLALLGKNEHVIAEKPKEQAKRAGATIGEFIREQREQAEVSMRQLARLAGVSNPYLSQIERGLRKPSADILAQIAKGLRISAEQLYIRAGILEFREGDPELVAAILADDGLGERQKQVLIDIYESFRRENAQLLANAAAPEIAATTPVGERHSAPAAPHRNQSNPTPAGK